MPKAALFMLSELDKSKLPRCSASTRLGTHSESHGSESCSPVARQVTPDHCRGISAGANHLCQVGRVYQAKQQADDRANCYEIMHDDPPPVAVLRSRIGRVDKVEYRPRKFCCHNCHVFAAGRFRGRRESRSRWQASQCWVSDRRSANRRCRNVRALSSHHGYTI